MSTKYNKYKKTKNQRKENLNGLDDLEKLAFELDTIARDRLPDGRIPDGILSGYEAEIRQEALMMALGGFLRDNVGYQMAVISNDDAAIKMSMERCVAIALRFAKRRIASHLSLESRRMIEITDANGGTCHHPSQTAASDWPHDVKNIMIMRAVHTAVQHGKLSVLNACIVSMICDDGMTVQEVAKATRITRSAVYQQINRVRRVIPEIMDEMEIPLL